MLTSSPTPGVPFCTFFAPFGASLAAWPWTLPSSPAAGAAFWTGGAFCTLFAPFGASSAAWPWALASSPAPDSTSACAGAGRFLTDHMSLKECERRSPLEAEVFELPVVPERIETFEATQGGS